VRDGTKGPLVVEAVQCRVTARLGKRVGPDEGVFITRELQTDGSYKHNYYLGHTGSTGVSLIELARVAKAKHRIEGCLQRRKSEAGLGTISGAQLGRVAPSPDAVARRRVVPGRGNAAGKKPTHRH
jgi:hypothetical protein